LWTLLASALLLAGVSGQATCVTGTPKAQAGTNNYAVDTFADILVFTYAINQCTATGLTVASWVKYTCEEDAEGMWSVKKSTYTTNACTGTATEEETWEQDGSDAGQVGYFKCDGDDTYAHVKISADDTCTVSESVYGGLAGCAENLYTTLDAKFYCDSTSALVQLFRNPTIYNLTGEMCADSMYCNKWTFQADCALATMFDADTSVYGKLVACTGTTTVVTETSSANSQFALLSAIIALVASFWMH